MDEADKLCDRIAIVDHGKLAALDTPTRLKDSVPGTEDGGGGIRGRAGGLDRAVAAVWRMQTGVTQREEMVHITSNDGPATVAALMDLARAKKVTVKRVLVQSDDARRRVFALHRDGDLRR